MFAIRTYPADVRCWLSWLPSIFRTHDAPRLTNAFNVHGTSMPNPVMRHQQSNGLGVTSNYGFTDRDGLLVPGYPFGSGCASDRQLYSGSNPHSPPDLPVQCRYLARTYVRPLLCCHCSNPAVALGFALSSQNAQSMCIKISASPTSQLAHYCSSVHLPRWLSEYRIGIRCFACSTAPYWVSALAGLLVLALLIVSQINIRCKLKSI